MSENNKCVYLHKDMEGVVRYVGSGTIRRAYETYAKSGRGNKYQLFVENNYKLEVEVVIEDLTKLQAEDIERELYEKYKDTLLNTSSPKSAKHMSKEMFENILYYDETSSTGLRWKVDGTGRYGRKVKANSEAGVLNKIGGYIATRCFGGLYKNHRIIAVLHGIDIDGLVIDHIDRNRANNRIENLRAVTQQENNYNKGLSSNNKSGISGVSFDNKHNRWFATWCEGNVRQAKCFPISKYESLEEALNDATTHRMLMQELHYKNKP